jgi:hypothetical protein
MCPSNSQQARVTRVKETHTAISSSVLHDGGQRVEPFLSFRRVLSFSSCIVAVGRLVSQSYILSSFS